jgi:hypothetical protein
MMLEIQILTLGQAQTCGWIKPVTWDLNTTLITGSSRTMQI